MTEMANCLKEQFAMASCVNVVAVRCNQNLK